jgi:hypothetical protein
MAAVLPQAVEVRRSVGQLCLDDTRKIVVRCLFRVVEQRHERGSDTSVVAVPPIEA